MDEVKSYRCDQDNCGVRDSSLCLENLDPDECSHSQLLLPEEDSDKEEQIKEESETFDIINLFSGDEIAVDNLSDLTYKYRVNLVLLMGDSDSGKTTLIASLFDLFQKGAVSNYYFAGSRTQIGFEKRCFLARWRESGRNESDTPHTTSMSLKYLHLAVRDSKCKEPSKHLLLSDVSGELFKQIRDHEDQMNDFAEIDNADHIFCLADGEALASPKKKHSTKEKVVALLSRAIQSGKITSSHKVNIVISRLDKIHKKKDEIEAFFVEPLKAKFPEYLDQIFYVASRSDDTGSPIKFGEGVDAFLKKSIDSVEINKIDKIDPTNLGIREFQKFRAD